MFSIAQGKGAESCYHPHFDQTFNIFACHTLGAAFLQTPTLAPEPHTQKLHEKPAFTMMKTVQAIIHCSDRVVILVHAEGDVGQSP